MNQRQLFLQHVAQTSTTPLLLEIVKAEGVTLTDASGKQYIDLISGISVSNVGHRHPKVVAAIKEQLDHYMHLMVYGEYIQSPKVKLATLLASQLNPIDSFYFVNSGSEAIEGSIKLARRYTGRKKIVSFKNAYHGSTTGALSLMSCNYFTEPFWPLLADVVHLNYNDIDELKKIDTETAGVFAEVIQGEAGAIEGEELFLKELQDRCKEAGALLIIDEIQTGFGRTGKLFAFMHHSLQPDIIAMAKGMGGGMPIGAFAASKKIMKSLSHDPALGHITTFGGHPVCSAASLATLELLLETDLVNKAPEKENIIRSQLKHGLIKNISGKGLLLAVEFENNEINHKVINRCIANGVITDWFLFAENKMRIAPPLTITNAELTEACELMVKSIKEVN